MTFSHTILSVYQTTASRHTQERQFYDEKLIKLLWVPLSLFGICNMFFQDNNLNVCIYTAYGSLSSKHMKLKIVFEYFVGSVDKDNRLKDEDFMNVVQSSLQKHIMTKFGHKGMLKLKMNRNFKTAFTFLQAQFWNQPLFTELEYKIGYTCIEVRNTKFIIFPSFFKRYMLWCNTWHYRLWFQINVPTNDWRFWRRIPDCLVSF